MRRVHLIGCASLALIVFCASLHAQRLPDCENFVCVKPPVPCPPRDNCTKADFVRFEANCEMCRTDLLLKQCCIWIVYVYNCKKDGCEGSEGCGQTKEYYALSGIPSMGECKATRESNGAMLHKCGSLYIRIHPGGREAEAGADRHDLPPVRFKPPRKCGEPVQVERPEFVVLPNI